MGIPGYVWLLLFLVIAIIIIIVGLFVVKKYYGLSEEENARRTYVQVCNELDYEPTDCMPEIQFQAWYENWLEDNDGLSFAEYVKDSIEAERYGEQLKEDWINGHEEMSVKDFFELRKEKREDLNFVGVYIIRNKSNEEITNDYCAYVGQATHIGDRVNMHFTGKGNGDVYADWKYGSAFTIKLLPLNGSEYNSLDKFEKDMIAKYHANETGYNKTIGNGD